MDDGSPTAWLNHHDVDEAAVYRVAVQGDRLLLGAEERRLVVAELTRRQESAAEIAKRLGVAVRTVQRHRARIQQAA